MKSIVAMLLAVLLFVQPVYGMEAKETILYTDVQRDETKESEDTKEKMESQEATEAQKEAEEAVQNEDEAAQEAGDSGSAAAGQVEVSAPSAILMESSTGQVIYEKDADTQRPPASVTKVMTLLLIFDALADGKIKLEDSVTTSEYAASMGGSQVFLEPGEVQTVDTLIKCISVASANDACVAFKNSRQEGYIFDYLTYSTLVPVLIPAHSQHEFPEALPYA